MINILQQAIEDKLTATFYTDKWPNILAVACEIYSPRISDVSHDQLRSLLQLHFTLLQVADLTFYGTSNEAVLQMLTEGKFITWGQDQRIHSKTFNSTIYKVVLRNGLS